MHQTKEEKKLARILFGTDRQAEHYAVNFIVSQFEARYFPTLNTNISVRIYEPDIAKPEDRAIKIDVRDVHKSQNIILTIPEALRVAEAILTAINQANPEALEG